MGLPVMDLWNMKNLEPPPINSAKADIKEIDVKLLSNVLKNAIDFFNEQPHLCSEAAVLSRTIYRLKMKFRSSKDFKAMEKLSRALRAYLEVDISKALKTFLDSVPQVYKSNKTYLPTKHMMDFVLVRIQGLGKILARILETCKIVCQLSQQRLRLGHFWKIALIIYGMSARIFVIVKNVMKYTCELYSNLVPYSSKLKNSGNHWLPDGYDLPENLSDWLEIDWMDLEKTIIEIVDEKPEPEMNFFNLIEDSDDDIEFCDEYILVKDEPSFYQIKKSIKEETVELSDNEVDIGEVIHLSDAETLQISNKENLRASDSTLTGFNKDADIGEVINLSPKASSLELQNSRKRKRGKGVLFETPNETINLKDTKTPQLKIPVKRKKLNPKTTILQDVIEIVDSPQLKIAGEMKKSNAKSKTEVIEIVHSPQLNITKERKKPNARSTTEVIEILDNSFNNEIINLSDIETPKTSMKRGKKRKRGKNSEVETVEFGFKVKNLNPNKKRKKIKGDVHNTTKDGRKLLQNNVQNGKKSKKKKMKIKKNREKNGIVKSKVHVEGTRIAKPKNQNMAVKMITIRKPTVLLNPRYFSSPKIINLKKGKKNTQSMNSRKRKHKKKKKRQQQL